MTRSFQEILTFLNTANSWLSRHPDPSKLRYAVKRVFDRAIKVQADYAEKLEEIDIATCATDEKGVILREPSTDPRKPDGDFQFTKDGLRERNKQRLAAFKSETTIEPHIAVEVLEGDLTDDEQEVFAGFVLEAKAAAAGGD